MGYRLIETSGERKIVEIRTIQEMKDYIQHQIEKFGRERIIRNIYVAFK